MIKLQSLCPLFLCPNYYLYAVTVGVADGGVADAINILCPSLIILLLLQEVARDRSALPGRFLSRHCFTLCITVEVEPRIVEQYICLYCCCCKKYCGKKKCVWGIL